MQQKAKFEWLKYGDANSKFYHAVIKGRQHKKKNFSLKKMELGVLTNQNYAI